MSDLINDILNDMRVELADEFDQNFSRGGFFGAEWQAKRSGEKSQLQGPGKLRKSIRATIRGRSLAFTSSEVYAAIHNDGGEIIVTPRMRKYFWAQYYKSGGRGPKAQMYKALALKRAGSTIKIPKRQYIGDHPKVREAIENIVRANAQRHITQAMDKLNHK